MKKKNSPMLRFVSMLEAIAIIATLIIGLSVPAFSAEIDDSLPKEFKELEEIPFEMPMEEGDLSLEELRYAELSESELPAVIDKQSADEKRHVKRLTAQEPDDYTVVFQNRDASKTVYIYSSPVKDGERDLSADEVNHLNDNAFSFESGCFFINSKNAITERLAKGSEREIRDYAVGCASIVTDSGIIIDITERLRNIAGTEAGIQSGIELGDDEREALIENEGLVYLTLTYSDISGVFSIKNNYDNKHLTFLYPNNRLYTNSTLLSIAGQWIFGYHSYGYGSYYDIRPLGKQWYHLGYSTSYTTVIAGDYQTVTTGNRYWTLDIVGEDNIYFHTKADDSYILNNTLGVETFNSDYAYPSYCSFRLLNPQDFVEVEEIEVPSNHRLAVGELIDNLEAVYPSDATHYRLRWIYTSNGNELDNDDEEGNCQTINESGIYSVYCKDIYSGTETDIMTVLVGEPFEAEEEEEKLTYMIRPAFSNSTDYSKLLTMGGATSGTNTVSIENFSNPDSLHPDNPAYSAKWTNTSQIFTIHKDSGAYIIRAILSANQYNKNRTVPQYSSESSYNSSSFSTYTLVPTTSIPNYVSYSGNTVIGEDSEATNNSWLIFRIGTITSLSPDVGKYVIYQKFGQGLSTYYKALKHTTNNSGEVTVSFSSLYGNPEDFEWIINQVGLDIPLIKQT